MPNTFSFASSDCGILSLYLVNNLKKFDRSKVATSIAEEEFNPHRAIADPHNEVVLGKSEGSKEIDCQRD